MRREPGAYALGFCAKLFSECKTFLFMCYIINSINCVNGKRGEWLWMQ